jgi:hypothetical protein
MHVGVENPSDAHTFAARDVQVGLYVAFGIHHSHFTDRGAADGVGKTAEALHGDLLEKHVASLKCVVFAGSVFQSQVALLHKKIRRRTRKGKGEAKEAR